MPDNILKFPDRQAQVKDQRKQKVQDVFDGAFDIMASDPGFKELAETRRKEALEHELKAGPAKYVPGDKVIHVDQDAYPWVGRVAPHNIDESEEIHRLGPSYRENDIDGPGHYYNVKWHNPKLGVYHDDYVHQDNLKPYKAGIQKMSNEKLTLDQFWENKRKEESLNKLYKALKFVEGQVLKKNSDKDTPEPHGAGKCEKCGGHLGAQNPSKVCDTCRTVNKNDEMDKTDMDKCGEMKVVKKSELLDRNDTRTLLVKFGKDKLERILEVAAGRINGGEEMKKSEKIAEALSKAEEMEVKRIVYRHNYNPPAPSFVKQS